MRSLARNFAFVLLLTSGAAYANTPICGTPTVLAISVLGVDEAGCRGTFYPLTSATIAGTSLKIVKPLDTLSPTFQPFSPKLAMRLATGVATANKVYKIYGAAVTAFVHQANAATETVTFTFDSLEQEGGRVAATVPRFISESYAGSTALPSVAIVMTTGTEAQQMTGFGFSVGGGQPTRMQLTSPVSTHTRTRSYPEVKIELVAAGKTLISYTLTGVITTESANSISIEFDRVAINFSLTASGSTPAKYWSLGSNNKA